MKAVLVPSASEGCPPVWWFHDYHCSKRNNSSLHKAVASIVRGEFPAFRGLREKIAPHSGRNKSISLQLPQVWVLIRLPYPLLSGTGALLTPATQYFFLVSETCSHRLSIRAREGSKGGQPLVTFGQSKKGNDLPRPTSESAWCSSGEKSLARQNRHSNC